MATRSFIIVVNPKGDFTGIYCHWDGYPSHVGKLLMEHYAKPAKVRELIRLGDLSSLGKRAVPLDPSKHSYDFREEGTTVAYHRDRNEPWEHTKPRSLDTLGKMVDHANNVWAEYVYLFWNVHWSFLPIEDAIENKPFIPLTQESIDQHQEF